ncbi:hypothetical protein CRENBAI_006313 [Crenichthys baileyi]|uniref:Uncharacterized protein n=1 Tax=Crenichthys baileyi TaxID=28760 RepID=A0AAV9RGC2_9TELE
MSNGRTATLICANQVCRYERTGASRPWKVLSLTLLGLDGVQPLPHGMGFKSCQHPVDPAKEAFSLVIEHGVCVVFFLQRRLKEWPAVASVVPASGVVVMEGGFGVTSGYIPGRRCQMGAL